MGYTIRTPRYRYVEWREWKTGELLERELYDHQTDPGEMNNLAKQSENASHLKSLHEWLNTKLK